MASTSAPTVSTTTAAGEKNNEKAAVPVLPVNDSTLNDDPEEEDDLDELDDVLEQFHAAPSAALTGKASSNVTSGTAEAYDRAMADLASSVQVEEDAEGDDEDDEDFEAVFAAELAKEMEKMLGGLKGPNGSGATEAGPSALPKGQQDGNDQEETEEERQFRETFEKILAGATKGGGEGALEDDDVDLEELSKIMNGLGGSPFDAQGMNTSSSSKGKGKASAPAASQGAGQPKTFEETIKATMSRLNESEASHRTSGKKAGADPSDPLAALMAQMEALGGAGGIPGLDGKDGDGQLPELLDGLMDQLMGKELLYDPICELRTKYPEYLASGEGKALSAEDRQRYEKQNKIVNSIYDIFESPSYSDTNKEQRERISNLMQEMQEAGAPPKHLLGELGPAMALNADGTPNVDPDQCIVS